MSADISGGERPEVFTTSGTPEADLDGPELTDVFFASTVLGTEIVE